MIGCTLSPLEAKNEHNPMANNAFLKKARACRAIRHAQRIDSLQDLGGGWTLKRDPPPGVGWVLKSPSGRRTYHASPETAKQKCLANP